MTMRSQRLKLLEQKAGEGNARAQYELGLMYYRGDGVDKNMAKARRWLSSAAAQGDRDANVLLNLRGLELNQGVEFRIGAPLTSKPQAPGPATPTTSPGFDEDLYESDHVPRLSRNELLLSLKQILKDTEELLPGKEPMRDRLIAILGAMILSVESKRMPIRSMRDQITPSQHTIELTLDKYKGTRFNQYKAKLIELCQNFLDIDIEPPVIVRPKKQSAAQDKHQYVTSIVDQIEAELKSIGWWSDTPPTDEQMNFTQAFAMDTMPLAMWIQFVLLPRVRQIILSRGAFPGQSMVGAQAVREYDGQDEAANLVTLLCQFDEAVEK